MPTLKSYDTLLERPVYGLSVNEKKALLLDDMRELTHFHKQACSPYKKILKALYNAPTSLTTLSNVPFLPVRIFKHQNLSSTPEDLIIKTMTSSGTSGQTPSKIFLDKTTARIQIAVLSRIMTNFIGRKRLPMLIIDCEATIKDRYHFSARTAGINGFSMFGRDITFALKDDMSLDLEALDTFTKKHADTPVLIFGFTSIIWQFFVCALEEKGIQYPLDQAIMIHGGGWKKLINEAVSTQEFKRRVRDVSGVEKNHNYYGMVEQTGSIFMACEHGYCHTSSWSDIIVRDPITFSPLAHGNLGLIELLSAIPRSYPGHALLSEDLGTIRGEDDCPCGRKGIYFTVAGRLPKAEIRGCSDAYT